MDVYHHHHLLSFITIIGIRERINQLLEVSADDLEMISECNTGEVCCILGLKHTVTGDTLVGEHSSLKKYRLHGLDIPPSVYSLSIEPERDSLQKELDIALNILCMEDPSLRVEMNKESGQTLLHGLGNIIGFDDEDDDNSFTDDEDCDEYDVDDDDDDGGGCNKDHGDDDDEYDVDDDDDEDLYTVYLLISYVFYHIKYFFI